MESSEITNQKLRKVFSDLQRHLDGSPQSLRLLHALFCEAHYESGQDLWIARTKATLLAEKLYPEDFVGGNGTELERKKQRAISRVIALKKDCNKQVQVNYNRLDEHDRYGEIKFDHGFTIEIKLTSRVWHTSICPQDCQDKDAQARPDTEEAPEPSDLLYVFASAPNLKKATEEILSAAASSPMVSLYKTFGDQDLLLRVRISGRDRAELLTAVRQSIATQQEDEPDVLPIAIDQELNPQSEDAGSRIQRCVMSSEGYEKAGCQRAFIRLQSSHKGISAAAILELLNRIHGKKEAGIVKSVAVGGPYAMIETFTRCSETLLLNRLSREIDQALLALKIKATKKTYICYEYHEPTVNDERFCGPLK